MADGAGMWAVVGTVPVAQRRDCCRCRSRFGALKPLYRSSSLLALHTPLAGACRVLSAACLGWGHYAQQLRQPLLAGLMAAAAALGLMQQDDLLQGGFLSAAGQLAADVAVTLLPLAAAPKEGGGAQQRWRQQQQQQPGGSRAAEGLDADELGEPLACLLLDLLHQYVLPAMSRWAGFPCTTTGALHGSSRLAGCLHAHVTCMHAAGTGL